MATTEAADGPGLDVAEIVSSIRSQRNLTQEGLARKLGVSFSTVNAWESGRSAPQLRHRRRLLEFHDQLRSVQTDAGTTKILCIDDSPVDLANLTAIIEDAGAVLGTTVEIAAERDAMGGLLALGQHRPSVAFIDIVMPGLDGFELAEQVRDRRLPVGRLVLVTSRRDTEVVRRAGELDLPVLDKPVSLRSVGAILRDVMAPERAAIEH